MRARRASKRAATPTDEILLKIHKTYKTLKPSVEGKGPRAPFHYRKKKEEGGNRYDTGRLNPTRQATAAPVEIGRVS
jgi:hypothetical protein